MPEINYFIKTTAELREAIGTVSENFSFENIVSDIEESAIRYLRNDFGIGKPFFDEFLAAYNLTPDAYNQFSADQKKLTRYLRKVTGNFAMYHYLGAGSFTIGASGAVNNKSENSEKVAKWQIEKAQTKHLRSAFEAFEQLLEFLEEKKTTFTTWAASDAKTIYTGGFLNTVAEFSAQYPMVQSRRTLRAIRAAQTHIEDFVIAEVMSKTEYDALKAHIKTGTSALTDADKNILRYIRPATAWLTMQKAFTQLRFVIDEKGLQVLSSTSNSDNYDESRPGNAQEIFSMRDEADNQAKYYLTELSDFLYENHAAYPLYEAATQYTARADNAPSGNDITKPSFRA